MPQNPTPTEAIRIVGRYEASQELPENMRADVRTLGNLLGQALRESGSPGLFEDVERLRLATIDAYIDDTPEAFETAGAIVDSFSPERAAEVARAFTVYFHLTNLAEEHQRVRALRTRDHLAPAKEPSDSVGSAFTQLVTEIGKPAALKRLGSLRFHPVFTAHPTEARRRAVSTSIRRLAELLDEHDHAPAESGLQRDLQRKMLEEVDTLWRTAPLRLEKPTPADEVRSVMSVFDETLFVTVPEVYRLVNESVANALPGSGDASKTEPRIGAFVRFGTWVGGDRDGNPFVTATLTRRAAEIASQHVMLGLVNSASNIGRSLTLDESTTPPSTAVLQLWQELSDAAPEEAFEVAKRSPGEPHRRVLLMIALKLGAELGSDAAYGTPEELLEHLRIVQDSLEHAGAERHAFGLLQKLIWQVQTYGFHLAAIEVRQHSAVHRKVLEELRAASDQTQLSEQATEVLETLRAIAFIQNRYGTGAAGRYIVSFTQSADDLIAVHELAAFATSAGDQPPILDVVPLFETFADLQAAPGILATILEHPEFAARLEATDRRLEVMLGYSDSSKDVGPVAATLALYEAQQKIADWARSNDIELTLFHGRGGALGRGGGPANSAILAQPPHSVDGRFKLTEQGEVIFARYGDPEIARRHIDQVTAAILLASAPSVEQRNAAAAAKYADIAAVMDKQSRERFFDLVKAPGFAPWFATVTPMEEIGLLALGSRPARRGLSVESLEDLRAIPWVFAWTQARINLAGWFGLGTALEAVGDVARLQAAYQEWPLLRTMIDNVAMSLAKTDERIARQYLALGDRGDLADLVLDELRLTSTWVSAITGGELLGNKPVLQRAVKLRSPYVDALSLLQLRALGTLRSDDTTDAERETAQHLLLLSVSGVAAGLQNTG